jgi:hypothetical protein
LATRDKLQSFMQRQVPASTFSFTDISHCQAYRVKTIQLTGHFVIDKVELQFYSLRRLCYIWVPLEVVLRTASYLCLLTLRAMMETNPDLERLALWDLNSTWDCRFGLPAHPIPAKKDAQAIVTHMSPLYKLFKYVAQQESNPYPKTLSWRS